MHIIFFSPEPLTPFQCKTLQTGTHHFLMPALIFSNFVANTNHSLSVSTLIVLYLTLCLKMSELCHGFLHTRALWATGWIALWILLLLGLWAGCPKFATLALQLFVKELVQENSDSPLPPYPQSRKSTSHVKVSSSVPGGEKASLPPEIGIQG